MVNIKNGIRSGHNEIVIYRIVKKNRVAKNRDKNTPPQLKDALNMPKIHILCQVKVHLQKL